MVRTVACGLILLPPLFFALASDANAQLFGGGRQLTGSAQIRSANSAVATGTVRNQRFLRSSRGRRRFVGRSRAAQFVGTQQARTGGSVRTAVSGATRGSRPTQVNQPFQPSQGNRPYDPRVSVGFDFKKAAPADVVTEIVQSLRSLPGSISVSVVDRTATLHGVVPAERERQLAEILTSFEPAIAVVKNELQLASDSAALPVERPPSQ